MLTDNDLMLFGKYKYIKMKDVPADYLDWLNEQEWIERDFKEVFNYIQDNIDAINKELEE